MKPPTKLLLFAVLVCPIISVHSKPKDTIANMEFARSITEFGLDILREVPSKQVENVILSPVSLINPLNMLLLGTPKDTVQREELERVLKYKQLLESSPGLEIHQETKQLMNHLTAPTNLSIVSISNLIAVNKDQVKLKDTYLKDVANYYDAQVDEFSKTEMVPIHEFVNKWVENRTRGMIKELADETSLNNRDSSLSLVNAVFFKGYWENEFHKLSTGDRNFTNFDGQNKTVKFMHKTAEYSYIDSKDTDSDELEGLNFKVLSLPYKGNEFDMVILLPNETNGIDKLQDSLSAKTLEAVLEALKKARPDEVRVAIPKFSLESQPDVEAAVKKLGLKSIFNRSNFAEMADGEFKVSGIVHKTKVEVDEKGTKAAAVTGFILHSLPAKITPRFVVNHSFMFLIRNVKSNTLLFIGRVNKL